MRFFKTTPFRLAGLAFALFVLFSQLARLALLVTAGRELSWNGSMVSALLWGFAFDCFAGLFAAIPWWLAGVLLPSRLLHAKAGKVGVTGGMVVYLGLLVFISVAEWFFWDEFSARFNFIAVDYLVWTQEVWGNINESYPMPIIIAGILLVAGLVTYGLVRKGILRWATAENPNWLARAVALLVGLGLPALAVASVKQAMIPAFANTLNEEIAKNGCWSFFAAFRSMELDYQKWYLCMPSDEVLAKAKSLLVYPDAPAASADAQSLVRMAKTDGSEKRWNVITICMESMSASYMAYAGGTEGLTPNLDRLTGESLFFENLYATGTRTVRGMEALTLNLPPTPGQAIIYRPDGVELATTFEPFIQRGYDCAFFYGGDGRFDFMNRYFGSLGCRVVDANAWKPEDTTFKTSWGACDEDLFNKTMKEAAACHAQGKPFHFFCMTTSNHRPYEFPQGRIDPSLKRRMAGVKYADWAVGDFLKRAADEPWFANTIFVIVADHCASSAGHNDLEVMKYHIPAIVYQPALVPARKVPRLCSQIDVMPTVFGLLGWDHATLSYGFDQLSPHISEVEGRALVSNYQKIALMRGGNIAILKPNRKVSTYQCNLENGELQDIEQNVCESLVQDAVTYYQSAAELVKSGALKLKNRHATQARPPIEN